MSMEALEEITECSICTAVFNDPRILSCIHTFCLQCLEETSVKRKSRPGDEMPCPLCRKPFTIPLEGMTGLQKNFFMAKLMDIAKISNASSNVILCEICKSIAEGEANETQPAVEYCIQCHQNICSQCLPDHKKYKALRKHQLVPIGSPVKDELIKKVSLQFCNLHSEKKAKLYCIDCKEVICLTCLVQKHKSHNCSAIDEVAEELCKQINCEIRRMSGFVEKTAKKIDQIGAMQMKFQKEVEDIENKIVQRGIELKERVDKCTRSLLDELALMKQRISKESRIKCEESETHKMLIESFYRYYKELSSKGSSAEICRTANDVHLRAEELQTMHEKYILRPISSTEVKFEKFNIEEFLKNENIIGNIRESDSSLFVQLDDDDGGNGDRESDSSERESDDNENDDDYADDNEDPKIHVRIRTAEAICRSDYVCGVTKLENKIYVLYDSFRKPNSIRVFDDQKPFSLQTEIELKEVQCPAALASSERSKCVYIADISNKCFWKMTIEDHRLTKWISGINSGPFTLSVTYEDHLLVARYDQLYSHLEIYGSDAKLIRCLLLPSDVLWPRDVIQKSNGEFIVSHRLNDDNNGPWVISRLSSDGQKVICRSDPNDKSQELKRPCLLALDPKDDRLFVADSDTKQTAFFDSITLKLVQIILTKEDGIFYPKHLWYNAEKKQIIMSDVLEYVRVISLFIS